MTDAADTTAALCPHHGIQPGQVAQRPESAHLHSSAQDICQDDLPRGVLAPLGPAVAKGALDRQDRELAGLQPDPDRNLWGTQLNGEIFFWPDARERRTPLLAIEAKNQQNAGNAIKRWFKNHAVLTSFCPGFLRITSCGGESAATGGCISRILDLAFVGHAVVVREARIQRWNVIHSSGMSIFRRVQGFPLSWMRTVVATSLCAALAEARRR
jgi:hypothetical protein